MSFRDAVGKTAGGIYNRTIGRLFGAGLPKGAESAIATTGVSTANFLRTEQEDWRVKLTLPQESDFRLDFLNSKVMRPLLPHGGVVFPLTPSVIIQHQATYNPLAVTHNNFPFYAYSNSETSSLTIIGEFPVQNSQDAQAWVATLHFFRTVTKMFFGGDQALRGNPPPVLKLNGYGNYVLKNVPVVVTNFSVELTQGVDYISTSQALQDLGAAQETGQRLVDEAIESIQARQRAGEQVTRAEAESIRQDILRKARTASQLENLGWAPTSSIFTVQVQPIYSRSALKNFSLQKFAAGELNNQGSTGIGDFGGSTEGIGFI